MQSVHGQEQDLFQLSNTRLSWELWRYNVVIFPSAFVLNLICQRLNFLTRLQVIGSITHTQSRSQSALNATLKGHAWAKAAAERGLFTEPPYLLILEALSLVLDINQVRWSRRVCRMFTVQNASKLTKREMSKCNRAAYIAMATALVDVFWQEGLPAFSHLRVNFSSLTHVSPPASTYPSFLVFFLTGSATLTANEGRGFCYLHMCVRVRAYMWQSQTQRECLCVCVCMSALGCLEECKARSWKRKSEKDKGRCALQLSSLDLFPLCY